MSAECNYFNSKHTTDASWTHPSNVSGEAPRKMFICWFSGGKPDTKTNYSLAAERRLCKEQQRRDVKVLQADKEEKSILIHAKCSLGFSIFNVDTSPGGFREWRSTKCKKSSFSGFSLVRNLMTLASNQFHPQTLSFMLTKLRKLLVCVNIVQLTLSSCIRETKTRARLPTKTFVRTWIVFSVPLGLHWD